ncbi:MAG: ATP-binding protein [Alkalinema sp. RU_4_3]|nr:ATP-binding protein [Alkalinema sp. RU_4_3]
MPIAMAAGRDLQVLQQLYDYDVEAIAADVNQQANLTVPLVPWVNWSSDLGPLQSLRQAFEGSEDWTEAMPTLVELYRQRGVGRFGNYWAFRWQQGQLVGLAHPDPVALQDLVGYEWQQQALVKNTESLLNGHSALNVLLYGSRGTGKSSLVKGLLSRYGPQGLRLVEIAKADLQDLPLVVEQVRSIPQKFIFFVDDLSFEADEEQFKALKVVLEGSITARPSNVVVYATSNRRHLIREYFSDRPAPRDQDELFNWDTVQEKLSFSDRFGLTLTFEPTDQDTYLKIVSHLAQAQDIHLDPDQLKFRALQWATQQNGRSGRTARQFIDFLTGEQPA